MDYIFFLSLIFILIIIYIYQNNNYNYYNYYNKYNKYNNIDTFQSQKDINVENNGNMKFNYLIDKNYTNTILQTYYLNDDTKINGRRVVNHPLQKKNGLNLYGNPFNQLEKPGVWGKFNTFSDYIYNIYGVRR